jgi:lysyl-tRNA synthetase class 2
MASRELLFGRVLAFDEGELLLDVDARERRRVAFVSVGEPERPNPGDWVSAKVCDGSVVELAVLTPYRKNEPFPSPASEFYRLHTRERIVNLARRSRLLAIIREFFARRDYLEVETPLRVEAPGLEPHLCAVSSGDRFLITSPEYQMKRLLVAGLPRIYSLGKCFRDDESGPLHSLEFTMLEWYRAFTDTRSLMAETEALVKQAARALDATPKAFGRPLDLTRPFARLSVAEASAAHAGVEIADGPSAVQLAERMATAGFDVDVDERYEELFCRLLVERVEPALQQLDAVFLCDFPAPLAALARLHPQNERFADRFELYLGGVELANAFGELTNPEEQRQRLIADQQAKKALGLPVYPLDERFLSALEEGMPPCSGIALGVDRLLMVLTGAASLRDTIAFSPDEV